jgi:hypothetical protein
VTTSNCLNDHGLTQSGALSVTPYTGNNKLYRLGLPVPKANGSFLVYGDGTTTFPWIADTAWSAPFKFLLPALGSPPSSDLWKNYVADRATKNFTVLLVAPATQYVNSPLSQPTPPSSGYVSFLAQAGCGPANYRVVPNECSYLDPIYWRKLDSMIKDANDAGLVVMVAGVIDPTDRGGSGTLIVPPQKYPRQVAAVTFARQLTARLSGSFVFFSPGFDDKIDELLDDGSTQVQYSMAAVGQALRGAVPRHLIGNQLGGGSKLTDYDIFHNMPWLNFEFYQSGHKGNMGLPCNYTGTSAAQEYSRAVCRAREMTLQFRCQGAAATVKDCPVGQYLPPGGFKPAVNSEGAYEDFKPPGDPDSREGERQTAYVSALSGSFGYTIGILGIRDWSSPMIYASPTSQSDEDLMKLAGLFKGGPWTDLEPRHNLIANNPPVNTVTTSPIVTGNLYAGNEVTRMVLAGNSSYALVYVPGVTPSSFAGVQIKTSGINNGLPGLSCSPGWTIKWVNPRKIEADLTSACGPGNGFITLNAPLTCETGPPCDWVIRLMKGKSASSNSVIALDSAGGSIPSSLNDLEVWTELSDGSAASAVMAQVILPDETPADESFVISPGGTSFQKLPTAARDSLGNFFVTWEAESPDTGLDDIYARRYDSLGNPLGDTFRVSQPGEGQQAEPSITADTNDNFAVSWTRFSLADQPSAVDVQLFNSSGTPTGDTIGLPTDPGGGVATMSLVRADGQGNLWVAWTTEDRRSEGGDVYAQRILRGGLLAGPPVKVNSAHGGVRRLSAFQVQRDGSFRVVWEGLGGGGHGRGLRARRYDSQGHPVEGETPVNSDD